MVGKKPKGAKTGKREGKPATPAGPAQYGYCTRLVTSRIPDGRKLVKFSAVCGLPLGPQGCPHHGR